MTEATDTAGVAIDDDVPTGNTYDKYASQNPIERRLMTGFFGALDASLPATAPGAILEVGVGEGEVAERLRARWPGVPIAGIDLPDHELAAHWIGKAHSGAFADIGRLPFPDDSFDLVLSSHLLFTYSDRLDRAFHRAALLELARVSRGQVRAFPLVSQIGRPETELVEQVMADLAAADVRASIRAVDYYFEPGAGSMLVLDP